ncbi:MAG: sulfatase [Akkermansiaceae bacterium]|nr:sulfatase [Akkermansiaceae bacterium]
MKNLILGWLVTATFLTNTIQAKPNIIFILSDDHAPHTISGLRPHMTAYGNHITNQTPNIDRIGDEGVIMANTFCENSICGPSRAAILTGKFSHRHGYFGNASGLGGFDPAQQHIGKLLHSAGYDTGIFGKWHLKNGGSMATPTGFNTYALHNTSSDQGNYYRPSYATPSGTHLTAVGTYCTDYTTDMSLAWLDGSVTLNGTVHTRDTAKPFALFCHFKAPHRNWIPGPDELDLWRDFDGSPGNDVGLDPTWPEPSTLFEAAASWPGRSNVIDRNRMTVQSHLNENDLKLSLSESSRMTAAQQATWDAIYGPENAWYNNNLAALANSDENKVRWKYQRYSKDYLRCIAGVDKNVGRILAWLDNQPASVKNNTIVIYTADQGFYIGDHGLFDKRWMYEESLRMPFLVRWPDQLPAGKVHHELVQNIDFAPILLDAVGEHIPRDMQGRSFLRMMKGKPQPDWRDSIYYHYYEDDGSHYVRPHYGIRTATHKLIRFYWSGDEAWEMYDLTADPDELLSIYADPTHQSDRDALEAGLQKLRRQYRVPGATPLRAYESFRD